MDRLYAHICVYVLCMSLNRSVGNTADSSVYLLTDCCQAKNSAVGDNDECIGNFTLYGSTHLLSILQFDSIGCGSRTSSRVFFSLKKVKDGPTALRQRKYTPFLLPFLQVGSFTHRKIMQNSKYRYNLSIDCKISHSSFVCLEQ